MLKIFGLKTWHTKKISVNNLTRFQTQNIFSFKTNVNTHSYGQKTGGEKNHLVIKPHTIAGNQYFELTSKN